MGRRRAGNLRPLTKAERAQRKAKRKRTHRAAKIWAKGVIVK